MRRGSFALGAGVLAAAWMGPLPHLARDAFWAHMTMHMAVVAVAAPLLALGIAGGPLDPVPRRPALFAVIPASPPSTESQSSSPQTRNVACSVAIAPAR